jgi:hypothetical protein
MIETNAESLNNPINILAVGGIIILTACGKIILAKVFIIENPKVKDASH